MIGFLYYCPTKQTLELLIEFSLPCLIIEIVFDRCLVDDIGCFDLLFIFVFANPVYVVEFVEFGVVFVVFGVILDFFCKGEFARLMSFNGVNDAFDLLMLLFSFNSLLLFKDWLL